MKISAGSASNFPHSRSDRTQRPTAQVRNHTMKNLVIFIGFVALALVSEQILHSNMGANIAALGIAYYLFIFPIIWFLKRLRSNKQGGEAPRAAEAMVTDTAVAAKEEPPEAQTRSRAEDAKPSDLRPSSKPQIKSLKTVDETKLRELFNEAEERLMQKAVLVDVGPESMVGVELNPEAYDDDSGLKLKCVIKLECRNDVELDDDQMERISDTASDYLRTEWDLDKKLSDIGISGELLDWWPVETCNPFEK